MRTASRYSHSFGDLFTDLLPSIIQAVPGLISAVKPKVTPIMVQPATSAPAAPAAGGGGLDLQKALPWIIGGAVLMLALRGKRR